MPIPEYYAAADYEAFSEAVDKLEGDCIVKPADNAGSRGVVHMDYKVHQGEQLEYETLARKESAERMAAYYRAIYHYSRGMPEMARLWWRNTCTARRSAWK